MTNGKRVTTNCYQIIHRMYEKFYPNESPHLEKRKKKVQERKKHDQRYEMKPPWSRGYNLVPPLDSVHLMGGKDMFYRGIFLSTSPTWTRGSLLLLLHLIPLRPATLKIPVSSHLNSDEPLKYPTI